MIKILIAFALNTWSRVTYNILLIIRVTRLGQREMKYKSVIDIEIVRQKVTTANVVRGVLTLPLWRETHGGPVRIERIP